MSFIVHIPLKYHILTLTNIIIHSNLSLKLKDSVICNTGDSITVMTVQTHGAQCTSDSNVALSVPPSPAPSSTASHSSEGESDISDMMQPDTKKAKYVCRFDVVVILLKV